MINNETFPSNLKELFAENPDIPAKYLLTQAQTVIILLDRQGKILDCNFFFMESTGITKKPIGRSIQDFMDEDLHAGTASAGDCRSIKLTFSMKPSGTHSLTGHILTAGNRFVIFAHPVSITESELVLILSKLTGELTDRTRKINRKNRELAATPLTGLINRQHLKELLDMEISKARRHDRPLSALITDIDHFKSINETYGHSIGNKILTQISQTLRSMCRKEDIVARFDGEEFIVILPDATAQAAVECAERIRKSIEDLIFPEISKPVTASFGATLFTNRDSGESFVKRMDTALYKAKKSGRNKVVLI